ncbi:MAG: C39 family peptidase [Nitrospirota bacterium]|jgi:ABC-type bacteriocin/lantibiotic exporter with double-glycine peptidase domain
MPALSAKRFLGLLVLPLLLSCAAARTAGPPARVLEGVPFYAQEDYQCGPASLAGVMNFWGVEVTPEDIAGEIFSGGAKGTLNIDLALYARGRGLEARYFGGTLGGIRDSIDAGYPVIVLVDLGLWLYRKDHFMVVVGYSEGGLVVNSGREEHKFVTTEDFVRTWEKAGSWTLLVKAP